VSKTRPVPPEIPTNERSCVPTHDELRALVIAFTDAFNREDLDAVMAYFTDDAFYDQFNGARAVGVAAIREAFVPQFRGDYGTMRFLTEDLFVDAAAGKAMISWLCTLERDGLRRGWRGLDLLCFEGRRVKEKHTYAKADVPRLQPVD
jgi:ketosteroid isomerase-like protein